MGHPADFFAHLLSTAILVGSLVVKLPQVLVIWRNRSVVGVSEAALVIEFIGYSNTVYYNVLSAHMFAAWGEAALITLQNFVLVLLYWAFTDQAIALRGRLVVLLAWLAVSAVLLAEGAPEAVVNAIGLSPTVLFVLARIPQVALNFKQGHTGALAPATFILQLMGNMARVLTTVHFLSGDVVTLLGHVSAATMNILVLMQVARYRRVTRIVMAKSSAAAASPKRRTAP